MKQEFDYYIFIDYSENLIGYIIIDRKNLSQLLKKTIKFRHFKELRHKRTYLIKIKKIIKRGEIDLLIYKQRISSTWNTLSIFNEVIGFIKRNVNQNIFISIDNKQYTSFARLFKEIFNQKNIFIISEDKLKKRSPEYRLSLIIDNLLNIERNKSK